MDRAHGFDEIAASQTPVGAVVSPTFFHDCMRRDMELVSRAYAILLMRGWEESTGANHELFFARACGVKVWLADYDAKGNIIGHVEAPEWLRSPKVYGNNGNPAYDADPPLLRTPQEPSPEEQVAQLEAALRAGWTWEQWEQANTPSDPDELAAREEQVVRTEIDQSVWDPPKDAPPLDYGLPLGKIPSSVARIATIRPDGQTILEEANHLIFGPRNADYGHPIEDFSRTGKMWAGVLRDWALTVTDPKHVPDVPPELVGLAMIQVKVSREVNKHKRDNLVDIGGYSGTLAMIADYREEHPENPDPICDCDNPNHVHAIQVDGKIVGRRVVKS
jgi:hypothetical protein